MSLTAPVLAPAPADSAGPANPFAPRPGGARRAESAVAWIFRVATYLVLVCGLFIFADIVWKGAPTVLHGFRTTATFPYVTNTFLFEAPESLYVF